MSDLYLTGSETKGFPEKGDSDYLTPQETAFVQRVLRRAEVFPQEFWRAIMQKVALDGEPIPRSQVQGLSQFAANFDAVATEESTTSSTYADLATSGPSIANLSNGTYLVIHGAQIVINSGGAEGAMAVQVNSTVASDADKASVLLTAGSQAVAMTVSRATLKVLDSENNNTITAKYRRISGSISVPIRNRWLVALKVGN